jgi:small subunit ribosomal protein S1
MSDPKQNDSEEITTNQLEEQYFKSMKPLEEGQLVTGTVIQVNSEFVFIDVGYKSEGKLSVDEFDTPPAIGDKIDVILVRKETSEGNVVVSKQKADERILKKNLKNYFKEKTPIEGKIIRSLKGGYTVQLSKGINAFLPLSKADIGRIDDNDIDKYVNMKSYFIIERLYSNNKTNLVVSRKAWLESENKKKRDEFFKHTSIGDEIEGIVKTFASFGAFIDLGGFDGLLHINDMSWGHITSPKELINIGDKLKLKVIRLDPEENRINLSLKHFTDDPWSSFESKYNEKDIVKGTVTKLTNFGAFIQLEDGIEGLVHISELSWIKKVKHPKEVLSVGDQVDVMILNYDISKGKVSLGLKQVLPNPWDDIEKRFPAGMRIKRNIKNLSNFGIFIEIENGIDGLIHVDDFSWTEKYKNPSEVYKEGDEIEAIITNVDKENRRIRLGIKQLSEDPWKSLQTAYPKGSVIEGKIKSISENGFQIDIQGSITGFIVKSNLFDPETENYDDIIKKYKEGDSIKATVLEINPSRQKLVLSRKEYLKKMHRQEMSKYIHDDSENNKVTLGDLIKEKSN